MQPTVRPMIALVSAILLSFLVTDKTADAQSYQYDSAGRLTRASYAGGASIRYEYDAAGQVTRVQHSPAPPPAPLPPDGVIDEPAGDVTIEVGESVEFAGTGTDPDGAIPLTYRWNFDGGAPESSDEDPGPVVFGTEGTFTVEFHVTDATDLSDPEPDTVVITVNASPGSPPPGNDTGNGNGSSGGGGGAVLWLPLILLGSLIARCRRPLAFILLVLLSGTTLAQSASWRSMIAPTTNDLRAVWGFSPQEVYAVGRGGEILFFDGTTWSAFEALDVSETINLNDIWGRSPDDLYVTGEGGWIFHFDGTDWQQISIGADLQNIVRAWSPSPSEPLYMLAGRGAWTLQPGLDPRDPGNWFPKAFGTSFAPDAVLSDIGGVPGEIIVTGRAGAGLSGGVYRNFRRLAGWRTEAVYALSSTEMFVVGEQSFRLEGAADQLANWKPMGFGGNPFSVWGTSASNMYAAGEQVPNGVIRRFDGNADNRWDTVLNALFPFRDIYGFGPDDIFAVGDEGQIYRYTVGETVPTAANFPYAGIADGNVNGATGELVHQTRDFTLGQEFPIIFERYYASNLWDQQSVGRDLGRHWTHNYEWRIDIDDEANPAAVTITDFRGRAYEFALAGGSWRLEQALPSSVSLTETGGTFLFADFESELIHAFEAADEGRLLYIEDRNGNRHTLNYNNFFIVSVLDDFGNLLQFEYDAGSRLVKVFLPASSTNPEMAIDFAYDGDRLISATRRFGPDDDVVTTYSYVASTSDPALLGAIEVGGTVDRTWSYGAQDRVAATSLTEGGTFEYRYAGDDLVVTSPEGTEWRLSHDGDGRLVSEQDGVGAARSWTYGADGRPASFTDRAGRTTRFAYEVESGLLNRIELPDQLSIVRVLEKRSSAAGVDFFDVVQIKHPDDRLELFDVDANGNTTRYRDQRLSEWLYGYDPNGFLETVRNPLGGTRTILRDVRNSIVSITDPSENVTQFSYDNYLRPVTFARPDGSRTELDWDGWRLARAELHTGAVVDYAYDGAGRLVSASRSDGRVVTYGRDGAGSVTEIAVNGKATNLGYDDHRRLTGITTPEREDFSFAFDVADNLRELTDGNGAAWSMQYHPDGVLRTFETPSDSVVTVENTLDPRGFVTAIAEGGERVQLRYDALGRINQVIDRVESTTNIGRDETGRVTSVSTPAADRVIEADRNAAGQIERVTDALGGIWNFGYDEQGRQTTATDPLSQTTALGYDEMNRVSAVDYADGVTGTIQYALSGLVGLLEFSDGTSLALDSTPEGRVMGGTNLSLAYSLDGDMTDSNGIAMTYYDDGRIRRVSLAPGRDVEYVYDGNGNLTTVADWLGGSTTIQPTDRGRPDLVSYPNGVQADYEYNLNGRLTAIRYPTIGEVVLSVAANGQVSSVDRNLPGPTEIQALDRQLSYDAASQVERFGYDVRGFVTRDDDRSYEVDPMGRITAYPVPGGTVSLTWDALGNIVASEAPGRERTYVYNYALARPQAMIERDGTGNDLWYYVFTDEGELLYRMDVDGNRQVFHYDENGNTAFITDDAGVVIRTYFYSPAGMVLDESGSVENDRTTSARFGAREAFDAGLVYSGTGTSPFDPAAAIPYEREGGLRDGCEIVVRNPVTSRCDRSGSFLTRLMFLQDELAVRRGVNPGFGLGAESAEEFEFGPAVFSLFGFPGGPSFAGPGRSNTSESPDSRPETLISPRLRVDVLSRLSRKRSLGRGRDIGIPAPGTRIGDPVLGSFREGSLAERAVVDLVVSQELFDFPAPADGTHAARLSREFESDLYGILDGFADALREDMFGPIPPSSPNPPVPNRYSTREGEVVESLLKEVAPNVIF